MFTHRVFVQRTSQGNEIPSIYVHYLSCSSQWVVDPGNCGVQGVGPQAAPFDGSLSTQELSEAQGCQLSPLMQPGQAYNSYTPASWLQRGFGGETTVLAGTSRTLSPAPGIRMWGLLHSS